MHPIVLQTLCVLITAHLIGDFVLQDKQLVKRKKSSFGWMILHSFIHAALAYLLLGCWTGWLVPLVVFAGHLLIDLVKSRMKRDNLFAFLLDQILHLVVIVLLVAFYLLPKGVAPLWFTLYPQSTLIVMVFLSAIILLTQAGGILIGHFVRPFQEQISIYYRPNKRGLEEGGKTIGWLERLLIFVFVLTGQYAGVGFLIAAKSIFRFGELKDSENRKEAEYIIIGTFASFLFALLVSLLTRRILSVYN